MSDVYELDKVLDEVASTIDTTIINPINAEQVKREFSGSEPEFTYAPIPHFRDEYTRLRRLRFDQSPEGKILSEKRTYLIRKLDLITAIGTTKFPAISARIHPLPSKALVREATQMLEQPLGEKPEKVGLMDAYRDLQKAIDQLGIPWRVQKINMIASASVMPSQRLVYLKRKMRFSKRYIERLKIHEIGTHAVRAENGRLQPLKVFLHGLAGYLPTEEGLAVYNEERFGLLDPAVLRTYAGRVVAVNLARNRSFTQIVEALSQYMSEKKAITLALRAKRGVRHGGQRGGYTKDTAYLKGFFMLKAYEESGGDFTPLYIGKVGLQHLPLLEKMDGLVAPKYFPEMLR